MRLAVKMGGFVIEGGLFKVRRAVGVSSYRRGNRRFHNLLVDVDGKLSDTLRDRADYVVRTPQGYHCIILGNYSKRRAFNELLSLGCDKTYAVNGFKRGYWFLESYKPIPNVIGKQLSFMEIERVAKNHKRNFRRIIGKRRNHRGRISGIFGF